MEAGPQAVRGIQWVGGEESERGGGQSQTEGRQAGKNWVREAPTLTLHPVQPTPPAPTMLHDCVLLLNFHSIPAFSLLIEQAP